MWTRLMMRVYLLMSATAFTNWCEFLTCHSVPQSSPPVATHFIHPEGMTAWGELVTGCLDGHLPKYSLGSALPKFTDQNQLRTTRLGYHFIVHAVFNIQFLFWTAWIIITFIGLLIVSAVHSFIWWIVPDFNLCFIKFALPIQLKRGSNLPNTGL
jgi:hypothetical protein